MLFYTYGNYDYDIENDKEIITSKYEECKLVKGIRIDRRTVSNAKYLTYKDAEEEWYENGRNHRVVNGYIERDFDDEFFIIEINTLEDLLDFQDKHKVNASVSRKKSGYVYNGEELGVFYADYGME